MDQYDDEHDPVRIQLPEEIEEELLAGVQRRTTKYNNSKKKVRIHDPSPRRYDDFESPPRIINKEAIEIPYARPRYPSRAERCIGAIMAGPSGSVHGLTGKALLYALPNCPIRPHGLNTC